ncbi:M24 family metallopeptidase [candidate division KSB1 bacterium]
MGIGTIRLNEIRDEFKKIEKVLKNYETIDKAYEIKKDEFLSRQQTTYKTLKESGFDTGIVFSDQHYNGDVPYLGGNTNISIEQVAGVIGKTGFHIVAGLEGGYIAEQLSPRSGSFVHKVELLQLADEKYPIDAEKLEDVIKEANGGTEPDKIGLLTPRQVIPAGLTEYLEDYYGKSRIIDSQHIYYKIKYEKSDAEMRLIRDANKIADAMIRGMLAVIKPGMLETQVAAWGNFIAKELGAEEMGWDIMAGSDTANRTLIGKALNRPIKKGEYVHLGVAPKRDGLNSCCRRSVIAVESPEEVTESQKFWFDFVEDAYNIGLQKYIEAAENNLPAKLQEQALVDFFAARETEVSQKYGKDIDLVSLKPYTGTHNAGYTECQEFYGAITLESDEPLGNQIVTMLDVAVRGVGNMWDDKIIHDMDFVVIENTLGKFGRNVEVLNKIPLNVQHLVGNVDELE